MSSRIKAVMKWDPILAIREWLAHRALLRAQKIFDRALRAQNLGRAERRRLIKRYGSVAMSVGKEHVMLDYDRLSKEDKAVIDAMIARQRGQDGAIGGNQGAIREPSGPPAAPESGLPTPPPRRKPPM